MPQVDFFNFLEVFFILLNPFFLGVLLPVLPFYHESFWVLRLPSLVAGITLIPLTYYLVNKVSSSHVALISTLLIAALPINIAYSRFGWDPSQITLATLIVIYFSWTKNWLGLSLAFIAALLIHPICLFSIPIIAGCFVFPSCLKKEDISQVRLSKTSIFFTLLSLVTYGICWLIFNGKYPINLDINRIISWQELSSFFLYFVRLFSGDTIYEYLVGTNGSYGNPIVEIIFLLSIVGIIIVVLPRLWQEKKHTEVGLFLGLLISIGLFYIFIGLRGLQPSTERYGVFLIVPTIIILSIFLSELSKIIGVTKFHKLITVGICVASFMMLCSFYFKYFQAYYQTGGQSEQTFMTAQPEPKKQAFLVIDSQKNTSEQYTILTEDFWLYKPLQYLGYVKKNINFVNLGHKNGTIKLKRFQKINPNQDIYVICWDSFHQQLENLLQKQGELKKIKVIKNYAHQDLLHLYELKLNS